MRTILHAYAHLLSAVVLHDNFMFLKCNALNIKCTGNTPATFTLASKKFGSLTLFGYSSCGLLLCHYLYMYVFDNKIEVLYRNNGKNNKILRTVLPDGSNSKYYPFLLFPF